MSGELPEVRRIVTANRPGGASYIAADGPAPGLKTVAARPGYRVVNAWVTRETPAPIEAADESAAHAGILPPSNGTVLRIIDFPPEPEDPEAFAAMAQATFGGIYRDADHRGHEGRHPGMHVTETVDYAIVLAGEIYAVMDEDETLMRAGDVLVQRGTSHAWANRSRAPCRIAFVLIDGRPGTGRSG